MVCILTKGQNWEDSADSRFHVNWPSREREREESGDEHVAGDKGVRVEAYCGCGSYSTFAHYFTCLTALVMYLDCQFDTPT